MEVAMRIPRLELGDLARDADGLGCVEMRREAVMRERSRSSECQSAARQNGYSQMARTHTGTSRFP
jgi:hypothetical protein